MWWIFFWIIMFVYLGILVSMCLVFGLTKDSDDE